MFSDVSAVFYRYFAGIRPDGGHSRIPQLPAGARAGFGHRHAFVQCGKPARHYFLQVGKRTGDTVTFTAGVPFGTTARLRLPAGVQAPENGAMLDGGRHEFCWKIAQSAG